MTAMFLDAQEVWHPTMVSRAVYFDKTPPLREMKVILPGERDRSWKEGLVEGDYQDESNRPAKVGQPEGFVDPVLQGYMGRHAVRGPIRNFDGVGNVNGVYPPDTEGDVSPDYYFQMINLSFAIYSKEGDLLYGPVDNSTLWDGFIGSWTGTNDGDPIVLYDHLADRWLASQFAVNCPDGTFWQLITISETNDPLGSWYRYAWQYPVMNDYPKLSVWGDAYYGSFRMFGSYVRGGASAFERDAMLTGNPDARMVYFDLPGTVEILPADVDGPPPPAGVPCPFADIATGFQKLKIYDFHVDWTNTLNSTFSLSQILDVEAFNSDLNGITQPSTSQTLDEMTVRLMYRLQYRNFGDHEAMVTNHTVNVNNHAGIRWYELRRSGGDWSVYQQGTYSPDATNRWMGSIAMNGKGDMALGYSVSGSTFYPSVRYTGRTADAPLGEMNIPEVNVIDGTGSQSGTNRWGDYSMMAVDPSDDSTFWYTQEYMKATWKTRIVSFDFGTLLPPEVDAGSDDTICEIEYFVTGGSAAYASSVLWSTSGDGHFVPSPPAALSVTYLRGPQDIANGMVTLTLTGYGYEQGMEASDSLQLFIRQKPDVFAGNDTIICVNHTLPLSGTAYHTQSVYWTTNGDGTFSDTASLISTYFPGSGDITNGNVHITLHGIPITPCPTEDVDYLVLNFDPCTGIGNVDNADLQMQIIPNPTRGIFELVVNGLKGQDSYIQVTDVSGNLLFTEHMRSDNGTYRKTFDLSFYPEGIYLVKVINRGAVRIEKVALQ